MSGFWNVRRSQDCSIMDYVDALHLSNLEWDNTCFKHSNQDQNTGTVLK